MAALKSSLPCYAAIPILEMYAETTIGQVNKKMCAPMFITPLFITERKTSRKIQLEENHGGEGGSWDPGLWTGFCELQFQIG